MAAAHCYSARFLRQSRFEWKAPSNTLQALVYRAPQHTKRPDPAGSFNEISGKILSSINRKPLIYIAFQESVPNGIAPLPKGKLVESVLTMRNLTNPGAHGFLDGSDKEARYQAAHDNILKAIETVIAQGYTIPEMGGIQETQERRSSDCGVC